MSALDIYAALEQNLPSQSGIFSCSLVKDGTMSLSPRNDVYIRLICIFEEK